MRRKSFRPWRVPSSRVSTFGTPFGNPEFCAGIFQMSQCVHVPTGASGSSDINANDWTPAGAPDHDKSGEVSAPSQVQPLGITPPGENAVVVTASDIALPPSILDAPALPDVRASRHANTSRSRTLVRAKRRFPRMGSPRHWPVNSLFRFSYRLTSSTFRNPVRPALDFSPVTNILSAVSHSISLADCLAVPRPRL